MDLRKIKKLMELVECSDVSELEVRSGDEHVRIRRASRVAAPAQAAAPVVEPHIGNVTVGVVDAPLAGTFYRAPAPGEAPFVEVGDKVDVGDVLCIIESMKMMNKIEAERAGEVAAVLADNGQPIESGAALFRIS